MRLKIIFTPLAFLVAVIVSIWYIGPEIQGIMTKWDEVKRSQQQLDETRTRKSNVELLKSSLDKNKDIEDFVLNFLPSSRSDEKVINSLNYIATTSGVNIVGIAMKNVAPVIPNAPAMEELPILPGDPNVVVSVEPTIVIPEIAYSQADVTVSGQYENIKMFLDRMNSLTLFNKANAVSITTTESDSSLLIAAIQFSFGYMPSVRGEGLGSAEYFSQSAMDFSAYEKLKTSITQDVSAIDEGQKGKNNPFLP